MYSDAFCKVYNEFGWNYFPEAFGEQLLDWIRENDIPVKTAMDLACGTGILCEILHKNGIQAAGMDFSEGMIHIARQSNPEIPYDVADMILYRPERRFDLVTCTGDALNHIIDPESVRKIFENVYGYLNSGGYFIFDLLNEKEIPSEEPFDLDFSETVRARFSISRTAEGLINLKTTVFENGEQTFEENIYETLHDPEMICAMLRECGFRIVKRSHQLSDTAPAQATTWFIIAKKD